MKKYCILILIIAMGLSGCKKLLDLTPTRQVAEVNMWNSLEDARAGLIGVYGLCRAALADNQRYWYYGDVRLADFTGPVREDIKSLHDNNLNAAYPLLDALKDWRRFYAAINAANLFLERAPGIHQKDKRYIEQNLHLDMAQVRVLRAYMYFYMVRIWGDVPLITVSHDGNFPNRERDEQEKVLTFVINELTAAFPKLPAKFDGNFPEQTGQYYGKTFWESDLVRKQTAWALLAHVNAWKGNYAETAFYAQKVMDLMPTLINVTNNYPLTTSRTRAIFRGESNAEVQCIVMGFSHRWQVGENSFTSGCLEHIALAQPLINNKMLPDIYIPKETLLNIYNEVGDNRFSIDTATGIPVNDLWIYNFEKPYPIFKKVFVSNEKDYLEGNQAFSTFASSTIVSRFEDMALLLAEAKAVLNDKAGAISLLNVIRNKHGLVNYVEANNSMTVLDAVYKERRRELIGEGHAFYDWVRYKKIKNNDAAFNKLLLEGGLFWPIAENNMLQNPSLIQNTYWQ